MVRKVTFFSVALHVCVSMAHAQVVPEIESRGFVRLGVGFAIFEDTNYEAVQKGALHYHEAALTGSFYIGYGPESFRAMAFLDHALADGVEGVAVLSVGVKGEVGVPRIRWLKLGVGFALSRNYAKLSDDLNLYEKGPVDTVRSPFWSIAFVPGTGKPARFFGDVRIGRSYGGDVISPQTGKPVATNYVAFSLGLHLRTN